MKLKILEQWKFKLAGRAVPVFKVEDLNEAGAVKTLHYLGSVKKRANSLVSTWDAKAWEIDPMYPMIRYIDNKGIESQVYIVSEQGKTCDLHTQMSAYPNREDVLGKAATMDDISEAMDLGKSMKNMVIGGLVGICLGIFVFAPMFQAMLK